MVKTLVHLVAIATLASTTHGVDPAQSFCNPPDSAKAWCYWWWLNGLASKEGITRNFEEMKKQGISGALLFDAETGGQGVPKGPVIMSPEWRELFKFAVSEADRFDEKLPPETRFTKTNVHPRETPLQPAGLVGPVVLKVD